MKRVENPARNNQARTTSLRAYVDGFEAQTTGRVKLRGNKWSSPAMPPHCFSKGRVRRAWVIGWNAGVLIDYLGVKK